MTSGLSRSGARIRGDDYQHLFAWTLVLRATQGHEGIAALGIEDPQAGNADDVTVYKLSGEREFFQVKSSVDAREPISTDWLVKRTAAGGPSIIEGFYRIWANASSDCRPKLTLVSNRLPAPGDPILKKMDGQDTTVARGLVLAKPKSRSGKARKMLAELLQVSEGNLIEFLKDLRFTLGWHNEEWIKWVVIPQMYAAGLRYDRETVLQGRNIVHGWVTEGKRMVTADELKQAIVPLKRQDDLPAESLLIHAIDHNPMPGSATIVLDWTDKFPGEEPKTRRQPLDPKLWNGQFRSDLQTAAQTFMSRGHTNILVQGQMRLPTWFAAGATLNKTAGFQVTSFQGEEPWSSFGELAEFPIEISTMELSAGKDLAVGIALAFDLSTDVLRYLYSSHNDIGSYVCIQPAKGASNQAIGSSAEARSWAYCARDSIRQQIQHHEPPKVHLFLAGPHGAILLLGHLWDRMRPTQIYEDLSSRAGYSPSFCFPN